MRKLKASFIFGGIIALKKLMSGSSKFGINLYWDLFDYSLIIYKAHEKITSMRQDIIKRGDEKSAVNELEQLFDKEFEIDFDLPVIKRSQIDTKYVSPDDLAILVNNQLIKIEKDDIKEDKSVK